MIRAWVKLMWSSAVVAAVAAAAQLGVADLLGIIRWDGGDAPARTSDWSVQLTWVGFSFTVAVLTGALAGRRALRRPDRHDGIGARAMACVTAALGAAAASVLAWLPAGDATPPTRVDPSLVVAITAGAGLVVGLVVALIALSVPPVAAGLRTAITWAWLVGIGSAVAGITTHQPYPPPRLAVLDAPSLVPAAWWSGPRLMIAVAALLGLVVALVARIYGAGRFGVALSGFGGPAIIAGAYLIAGPGVGPDRAGQYEPYVASMIAAGAGLLVSVLVAMPGRRGSRPERDDLELGLLAGDVVRSRPPGPGRHGSPYAYRDTPSSLGFQTDEPPWHSQLAFPHDDEPTFPREPLKPAWPAASTQPDFPTVGPRHVEPRESGPTFPGSSYSGGTSHGGTTDHASPYIGGTDAAPAPVMGQPPQEDEPQFSWLRDLGSTGGSGRHYQ